MHHDIILNEYQGMGKTINSYMYHLQNNQVVILGENHNEGSKIKMHQDA